MFIDEIHSLKSNKLISSKSKLLSLNTFMDSDGILRVGGRLSKSNIPSSQRHPIILDKSHAFSKLIIVQGESSIE